MITPPRRPLLVVPKPCPQCDRPVREAWLVFGSRRRRHVRRVVVHHDPVGPLRLTATNRLEEVGPPSEGLAGHEPTRYALHHTATCDLRSPEDSRHISDPPFAGVTGPRSSAAGTRPPAADDEDAPSWSADAHTAHGPKGAVAMQGAGVNGLQGLPEGAARGMPVGQPSSFALPARCSA